MIIIRKANKRKCKLKMAICAPSGAGKTYGALSIAKGIGGKVVVIDTENGSADLYSDKFEYDVCQLDAPFTPKKYIDHIEYLEKLDYSTIVIDSLSHAWAGPGGVLDMQDLFSKTSRSQNSYTAWREVTPHHNALVNAIIYSKCNIIATMRSKTAYEIQNTNGRATPVKVGLAPVQRDGVEYEFTLVLDVSVNDHIATASKDRTSLFDGQAFRIDESVGEKIKLWLDDGVEFSMEDAIQKIKSCTSIECLKTVFSECYSDAKHGRISKENVDKLIYEKEFMKRFLSGDAIKVDDLSDILEVKEKIITQINSSQL